MIRILLFVVVAWRQFVLRGSWRPASVTLVCRHASAKEVLFGDGTSDEGIFAWHKALWSAHLENIKRMDNAHATFMNEGMLRKPLYQHALSDTGLNEVQAGAALKLHRRKKLEVKKRGWDM